MGDAGQPNEGDYDVLIVGAGISGINAAYRVQQEFPGARCTILEARDVIGGTWSFFKYPGLRSDSDIYSFAFAWSPWEEDRTIADGGSILRYLEKTAREHGIDRKIQFGTKVTDMDWRTELQRWRVTAQVNGDDGEAGGPTTRTLHARFIVMSTGYYDYTTPLQTTIPGLSDFTGVTVHPQFWPSSLDYTGQKVVVIGSGATAVTLVPALAQEARHVTMLQRSPGHFLILPATEAIDRFIKRIFSTALAYRLIRLRMLLLSFVFVTFCRLAPGLATRMLRAETAAALPPSIPVDPHFVPRYNPFEQRVCITPDGDFFATLRAGKGDVVTGQIRGIEGRTIVVEEVKSGATRRIEDVDIIVTATGLKIQVIGGIAPRVDGVPVDVARKYVWRGACLQDVPNLCFIFGYTDNAWTLGSDSSARLFVRLIKVLERSGNTSFVPAIEEEERGKMVDVPLVNMSSSYVSLAKDFLPRSASVAPWKPRWHYFQDWWFAGYGDVAKGMKMVKISS